MIILAIESTCDETAIAIVKDGRHLLFQSLFSQSHVGGVFPEMAARMHAESIIPLIKECLEGAKLSLEDLDAIAVAATPGLLGSLLVGVETAKALAFSLDIPLIPVDHLEAHLYAAMMGAQSPSFPSVGAIFSGGHSLLLKMESLGAYEKIATTLDDALGEAFDKVARLLEIPYPGGPKLEELAKEGNPKAYPFKAGNSKNNPFAFSFSGLKTQCLYASQKPHVKADLAASFQEAALSDAAEKCAKAARVYGAKAFYLGGGVACNKTFQGKLKEKLGDIPLFVPPKEFCTDNAVMIGGLAFHCQSAALCPSSKEFFNFTPKPSGALFSLKGAFGSDTISRSSKK